MKAPCGNRPDVTNLKPCDHQSFFETLDSLASPTEALRAAFRRRKDAFVEPALKTQTND